MQLLSALSAQAQEQSTRMRASRLRESAATDLTPEYSAPKDPPNTTSRHERVTATPYRLHDELRGRLQPRERHGAAQLGAGRAHHGRVLRPPARGRLPAHALRRARLRRGAGPADRRAGRTRLRAGAVP